MLLHLENPHTVLWKVHVAYFKCCAVRVLIFHWSSRICIVAQGIISDISPLSSKIYFLFFFFNKTALFAIENEGLEPMKVKFGVPKQGQDQH